MAIFKDKTGRGEVDYAKSPVQGSDGTILFLNDRTGMTPNVYGYSGTGLHTNHVVFQLRGESGGVQDVSDSRFSVTESTALTKRIENVTHNQKLKTFEFNDGRTATFSPKLDKKYQRQETLASLSITLNIVPSVSNTISITFGSYGASAPQVITMAVGAGTDSTSFSLNAATIYAANNATTTLTAASIAVLANSVNSYTATSLGAVITITATNPDVNLSFTYSETISVGNASDVVNTPGVTPTQWPPNLGRGQGHSNSPHESILPFEVGSTAAEFNTVVEDGDSQIILSFWVRPSSFGQGTDGGGSCIMEQVSGTARGFGVILTSTGELVFRFYDFGANSTSANAFQQIKTIKRLVLNQWYHITIFAVGMKSVSGASSNPLYNPGGLDQSHASGVGSVPYASPQVEIYINGSAQTDISELGNTSGNFAGNLNAVPSMPVVLGTGLAGYDSTPEFQSGADANFNGRLAEVTYFYTHSLERALNQIAGAANVSYRSVIARSLMTGTRQPTSGITNVSERLLLRDADQHSAHPTVKRSGDSRRLGNHKIKFDDSRAQTLTTTTVQYPTKLVNDDNLINTIYSGYHNGNLTTNVTASVDAFNTFYRRNDQPSHLPFVESRIYIDSGSSFYQTGTLESVLPGFDQPLQNKHVIEIVANNTTETRLGFDYTKYGHANEASSVSLAQRSQKSRDVMAYFNFKSSQFDTLTGPSYYTEGANEAQKYQQTLNNLTGSAVGFGRFDLFASCSGLLPQPFAEDFSTLTFSLYPDDYYSAYANPIDNFGFPNADHYKQDKTKSIKMSDYISEPFLLEKIVFSFPEISAQTYHANTAGPNSGGFFVIPIQVTNGTPYTAKSYNCFDGHENLTAFLLHQQNVASSFTIRNEFDVRRETQALFHNQSYSSLTSRNIVTYGNSLFIKQDPGYIDSDGLPRLNDDGTVIDPDRGTLGQDPTALVPGNNTVRYTQKNSPGTVSGIYPYVVPISGSTNLTGVNNWIEIINQKFPNETLVLSTRSKPNRGFNPGTNDCMITGSNVQIRTTPKIAKKITYAGSIQTTAPKPSDLSSYSFASALIQKYSGFSSNNNYSSPRIFSNAQSGQSDPTPANFLSYGSNDTYATAANVTVSKSVATGSVYVLMPDDDLIFGIQSTTEMDLEAIAVSTDRSFVKIPPGEIKISLFGSFLRNSQPRQFQLNQLLNNGIVHESIGSESIHDQFDTEPNGSLSGSYVDETMSGSLEGPLYNGWNNKFHCDNGGSSVSAALTTNLARRVGARSSIGNQGTTGSLRRTVSIASHDVTEYDSFLFDLESMFSVDERSIPTQESIPGNYQNDLGTRKADDLRIGNDPSLIGNTGTNAGVIANVDIGASFFYHRYNTVDRVRSSQIGKGSTTFTISVTGSYSVPGLIDPDQPSTFIGTKQLLNQRPLEVMAERAFINSAETSQFMFGIGEGVQNAHVGIVGGAGGIGIDVEKIRGFRYGFSNVVDKKPRNVYRRDRYGQLRDMLEMAPNTAYINDRTNQITYPIEARFFDNDGSIIQPGNTSCSNLSTYCTSSAPYFDRDKKSDGSDLVIRNRGPLNNKIADITIEI